MLWLNRTNGISNGLAMAGDEVVDAGGVGTPELTSPGPCLQAGQAPGSGSGAEAGNQQDDRGADLDQRAVYVAGHSA